MRLVKDLFSRLRGVAPMALILLLVGVMAVLQVQWILQASEAEEERLREQLSRSVSRLARDFTLEVERLTRTFVLGPESRGLPRGSVEEMLERRWEIWQRAAAYPGLLAEILVLRPDEPDGSELQRFEPGRGLVAAAWTPGLEEIRHRSSRIETSRSRSPRGGRLWPGPFLSQESLTLALPLPPAAPAERRRAGGGAALLLRLDEAFLTEALLPELVDRNLGSELDVVVRWSEEGGRVLFSSVEGDTALFEPEARGRLFGLGPPEGLRSRGRPPWRQPSGEQVETWEGEAAPPGRSLIGPALAEALRPAGWEILVAHRGGSLDEIISRTRRRNLLLAFGVLLLLLSAGLLLATAASRARRLARQQVEFVASLTHELHTPLAAIRSAAENLADGVVADPRRVRSYGALIHRQGSRLSAMVAQALELSGMEGAQRTERRPVEIAAAVQGAIEACESLRREKGVELRADLAADLPAIDGYGDTLQQAVENLLVNAIKYGDGRPVTVRGRRERDRILLEVEDRGRGIPKEEQEQLFEPFFRGKGAEGVDGSGLGLSLVRKIAERHGGEVRVKSEIGRGTTFVVELPIGGGEEGEDG